MNEDTARATLRLIAITSMLVGCIMTLSVLLQLIGVSSMQGSMGGMVKMTGMVARMGLWAVLGAAMPIICGFVLYFKSGDLARRVVAD